jgi:nitrite reductase/ring-hydroxylating ferredoxin subunit/uncharacterized membrane protein
MSDARKGEAAPPAASRTPIDERLQQSLDRALYAGGSPRAQTLRNFLNGVWLGEPLHAIATDIPTGAWSLTAFCDLLEAVSGNPQFGFAADLCLGVGLAGAAAAAATGLADWSDVDPPARRTGMYHGLLNLGAIGLYTTSLVFRRKKQRGKGRLCAIAGFSALIAASRLGGDMVYQHRIGVDRTSGEEFPEKFTAVLPESRLPENTLIRAEFKGTPIVLVRREERIFALSGTCSHAGAPLAEGKLKDNSVVCPWHSSRFCLESGRVLDGPAVHPQPCLEARAHYGQIEVRKMPQRPRRPKTEGEGAAHD